MVDPHRLRSVDLRLRQIVGRSHRRLCLCNSVLGSTTNDERLLAVPQPCLTRQATLLLLYQGAFLILLACLVYDLPQRLYHQSSYQRPRRRHLLSHLSDLVQVIVRLLLDPMSHLHLVLDRKHLAPKRMTLCVI
jgi:hypothetical protein